MTSHGLTLSSPLHKRFLAWMDERFPLANSVVVIVLYLVSASVARFAHGDESFMLSFGDLGGAFATWTMFLLLRVFDEHKDYELDVKNYPERVLQSGLITLNHLKVVGGVAVIFQVAWSWFVDDGLANAMFAWLIMIVWAGLMTAEFFCGEWLEKRLTLYAVSHMAIMPLLIWWVVNLAQPGVELSNMVIALMALAFFSGFCFEITRKTRGPDEERETVDSYTKIYGVKGCGLIILSLLALMAAIQIYLLGQVFASKPYFAVLFVLIFIGLAMKSIFNFVKEPTLAGREKNEKMIGLAMIGGYTVVIVSVIVQRGVSFSII